MKNVVGQIKVYKDTQKKSLRLYMCKDLALIIGTELVFSLEKLSLRRPSIDSKKTYSAKNKVFTCTPKQGELEDYFGIYNVIQVDEDNFILKKCQ